MGEQVVAGQAAVSRSGSNTLINQSTDRAAINWTNFDIGAAESVRFVQPSSSSIALNRVLGQDPTGIVGSLGANGQVFILNPNGVLFGQGAQVNVGGLVASTLSLGDADFMAGRYSFVKDGTAGSVVNRGMITGGYVAFLGSNVGNQGTITSDLGAVALAAGGAVTLTFAGNSLVHVQVDQSTLNNLAENGGLIRADGGMLVMSAGEKDALLASVVNNTGVIEARTMQNRHGTIVLLGGMQAGTVNVGGTLDASAPNGGNGGLVETSAAQVHVAPGAKVTTLAASGSNGTWLIDPVDFMIAASGGDMTGATVGTALAGGNFTILSTSGASGTAGNINVNDAVTWSANTLTLNAQNNINIAANLDGSGGGSLALLYGQANVNAGNASNYYLRNGATVSLPAGNNFSTTLGNDVAATTWTVMTGLGAQGSVTGSDLQGMSGNLAGNYALGANIDATATLGWNAGAGFAPVGSNITKFTGSFAGLGHTVTGLTIARSTTNYVGLFGYASGTVRDVGLLNSNIGGQIVTGTLAGRSDGSVSYSFVDGGSVAGAQNIVGGLIGQIGGEVSYSYANVSVTGQNSGVSSTAIGGLVGSALAGSTISNSYAAGSVSGGTDVAGLVGQVLAGATVTNGYSTGALTWTASGGGLIGLNSGTVAGSYWDTATSGKATSAAGTGLTTAQMQSMTSFAGWSIANSGGAGSTWRIYEGQSYPLLENFLTPLNVAANNASKTYDGLAYGGGNGVSYSVTPNAHLLGSASYGGSSQGAVNAGSYVITPSGFYSTSNRGYDVSYTGGTLTVNKANLSASITASNKTYDGTTVATPTFTITGGLVGTETVTASGTASFSDKNAGTGKTVTAETVSLADGTNGGLASNYALSPGQTTAADITAKALTASIIASNKTYDGTTMASPTFTITGGLVGTETVTASGTATFSDKNAGNGKTVTADAVTLADGTNGGLASNYALSAGQTTTADIAPATLTVNYSGVNKVYDATTAAGVTTSDDRLGTDVLTINRTAAFTDKNAGVGKTVNVTGVSLSGTDAGNYTVATTGSATADITPAALSITADDKTKFPGTPLPAFTATYNGFIPGETPAGLNGVLAFSTPATIGSPPGVYGITPFGRSSVNYSITYVDGLLTVLSPLTTTPGAQGAITSAHAIDGGVGIGIASVPSATGSALSAKPGAAPGLIRIVDDGMRLPAGLAR